MALKIIIFLFCTFPLLINGQSPYQVDWKKESIYFGVGGLTLAGGLYLHYKIDPLTIDEIYALNRSNISSFDRSATSNYSPGSGDASDALLITSHTLPLFFLMNQRSRKDFTTILVLYSETFLITKGITNLTKRIVKRNRPFVYNEHAALHEKQQPTARYSFFSGHTSKTSANCFFVAKLFSDYFPDSSLKPYIWTTAAIIPALTGHFRVKAGKHFYSDVITGYLVGGIVGFMVPHLHKVQKGKAISLMPAPNGLAFTWKIQ